MKSAPLKGKKQVTVQGIPMYDGPDIRAAVEWLRKKLKKELYDEYDTAVAISEFDLDVFIDEAFKDVMKK